MYKLEMNRKYLILRRKEEAAYLKEQRKKLWKEIYLKNIYLEWIERKGNNKKIMYNWRKDWTNIYIERDVPCILPLNKPKKIHTHSSQRKQ